jgi:predicted transcriptional regulator
MERKGNPNPAPPSSRGIPSDESMWLPRHYGKEVKEKGGLEEDIIWSAEDVVDFIFPKAYQPKYYQVAVEFLNLILENETVTKDEIGKFLKQKNYSRSTLENKIIPKLVRFGLVKREREIEDGNMGKGRSLILSDSLTFANYLSKIGTAWKSQVLTARHKRKKAAEKSLMIPDDEHESPEKKIG